MEMTALDRKPIKVLLILGPTIFDHPDLTAKKINEITAGMDEHWRMYIIAGARAQITLPCPLEIHTVPLMGSSKSVLPRVAYLLSCIIKGAELVKKESIHVVTQHDGHLEYGMVAYIVSRLTHRKCLIRVNEDTLIPLMFFLRASGHRAFKSKTILRIVASVYRRMECVLFEHADWVITHGPMDYQKIKRITNRITFVPLSIDTERFRRLNKVATREFREKFSIAKNAKVILFVGRLHPEKGVETLLKAIKLMQDWEVLLLMVYSVSDYKKDYEKLAEQLGISNKVRFLGYVPHAELPKYYSMADLYVLPSMREEWSNTIMEAMACEAPVVATEVGANPYLVIEGKTGFLAPPNDPSSLAKKMCLVFENPELIKRIVETAACEIRRYNQDKIGELYKTVVKNMVRKPDARALTTSH